MNYYNVVPGDRNYRGSEPLTYCYDKSLDVGQVVVVKLRTKSIDGFIISKATKPSFTAKSIEHVYEDVVLPAHQIEFFNKVVDYYPSGLGSIGSLFLPNLAKTKNDRPVNQSKNVVEKNNTSVKLTTQQKQIINEIISSEPKTHIVHGDTGTGKTMIYFELAKYMNTINKSSLILTPEISLTPQLAEQFSLFFNNVFVVHSNLTLKQKRDVWIDILNSTEPVLIIGPRSAIFMPIKDLGLIVIDEFQDDAYKQDQSPKYRATRLGALLSKINSSVLVLGSATPPVDDYYFAEKMFLPIHRLTEKPLIYSKTTKTLFVNLNDKSEKTNHSLISKTLLSEITKTLANKQQVLIFHNRRGSLRTVLCENCGNIETCVRCNIPYIYHRDANTLICHTCSAKKSPSTKCSECGSISLIFKNPGTKEIEEQIRKLYPEAKINRYDKDNKKSETFYSDYAEIKRGDVDILIGTQILTKGHDLPNLGLVCVLLANSGLQFPDFSSEEKNFFLIHQASGRVGRGHSDGRVVIQYYMNNENTEKFIEQKIDNWEDFYKKELEVRKAYNYPPFTYMLKIVTNKSSQKTAQKSCEELVEKIHILKLKIEILGPSPQIIEKKNNKWYWQIVIKSKDRSNLIKVIGVVPSSFSYDLDPTNLL